MEIYHLSNKYGHVQLYKIMDFFFASCYLENGLIQVKKMIEIDNILFDKILNNIQDFDQYSLRSVKNTDLLQSFFFSQDKNYCEVYQFNHSYYFIDKWNDKDIPLNGKRIAVEISKEEFEKLKMIK